MSRALLRQKPTPQPDAAPPPRPRKPLLKRPEPGQEAPPAAASLPQAPAAAASPQLSIEYVFLMIAAAAVVYGFAFRHSDAVVPYEGTGYYLGIAGSLGMALQLGYASAKRLRIFHRATATRALHHLHMILGLAAPIAILYHCKFSWGARNSNIALIAMFLVVASGLAGRIVHRKVQAGLRARLPGETPPPDHGEHLRKILSDDIGGTGWLVAERLSALGNGAAGQDTSFAGQLWTGIGAPFRTSLARMELARLIRGTIAKNAALHGWSAEHQDGLRKLANQQVHDFLRAHHAAPQRAALERLLSSWYLLHVPLFYFLVLAGIAHVFSVHWY